MTGAEICCVRILRPLLEPEPCECRFALAPDIHAPTEPPECVEGTLDARWCPCRRLLYRRATKTMAAPYNRPPVAIGAAMAAAVGETGEELLASPPKGAPPPWAPGETVEEGDAPVALPASSGWPAIRGMDGRMRLMSVATVASGLS